MVLIGARILEYRKAANMSQEEFALKIGVSRQAVSKWELDKAYPDLDKLVDICEIFNISIDELVHGKQALAPEAVETQGKSPQNDFYDKPTVQNINVASAGMLRGRTRRIGLHICAVLSGLLFLFCCTVFVILLLSHAWNKDNPMRAKVERVYQQYTKADISFIDDDARQVQETVWLDIDGIRDGDYVECYTDGSQQAIHIDYYMQTLIVPGILMLLFLCIFILLCAEMRRVHKENQWYVLVHSADETEIIEENKEESEAESGTDNA